MKIRLIDAIDTFISGDWGNDTKSEETPYAVSCIRGADIVPVNNSNFSGIPIRFVSKRSLENKTLLVGDIIVEKSGGSPVQSTGRVCFVSNELFATNKNLVCSNFCVAFRVKKDWNPKYIYLYLQHIYNAGIFFNFEGKTSGIKNLQLDIAYRSINIDVISLEKQGLIEKTISTLDRKISLNRAINQNLEAMAKQLYDYWFVQFDFPNEEGKPYKSSGGKMVWNEKMKREIPVGWNEISLSSFIANTKGGDWGYDTYQDNTIRVGCVRGADIVKLNNVPTRYITEKHLDRLLDDGDIVIEVSGGSPIQATGRVALITNGVIERNGGAVICSNFCQSFSLKNRIYSEYLYYLWKSLYDNDNMFNFEGKTSGIKNFQTDVFLATRWMEVPENLIMKFHLTICEYYKLIDKNIAEQNNLTKQRDELLPLLMNGQVSVNSDLSVY